MCSSSSSHCQEPDACCTQHVSTSPIRSPGIASNDAAAAADPKTGPTPWLARWDRRMLAPPSARGTRKASS
jgi:hypothetical protein